ncbi:MAG: adenosine kinase [Spirochaetes bacterium]|nr:adenosine kinase [Spirochaetota bacterium]
MNKKINDIIGIGSPLIDFTIDVDDSVLSDLNLKKGQMHLIDENKSGEIFNKIKNYQINKTPGGSAANTLAGLAILGGNGVLFGKVGNDENAEFYIDETEKIGVKSRLRRHNSLTGHCITFITPDSERTFATHLGSALNFRKDDVDTDEIQSSRILHIEGYLLELPEIREAVIFAANSAKQNDVRISVDLADPGLILRIPDVIDDIVKNFADIVFVNEMEAMAFTNKEKEEALDIIYSHCDVAIVKLGDQGSLIKKDSKTCRISVCKTDVVNTNGAGDMYAAGILYGLAKNIPIERAGRIASYASSLVVSQVGARLSNKIYIDTIN